MRLTFEGVRFTKPELTLIERVTNRLNTGLYNHVHIVKDEQGLYVKHIHATELNSTISNFKNKHHFLGYVEAIGEYTTGTLNTPI